MYNELILRGKATLTKLRYSVCLCLSVKLQGNSSYKVLHMENCVEYHLLLSSGAMPYMYPKIMKANWAKIFINWRAPPRILLPLGVD